MLAAISWITWLLICFISVSCYDIQCYFESHWHTSCHRYHSYRYVAIIIRRWYLKLSLVTLSSLLQLLLSLFCYIILETVRTITVLFWISFVYMSHLPWSCWLEFTLQHTNYKLDRNIMVYVFFSLSFSQRQQRFNCSHAMFPGESRIPFI